jgi:CheY-like chemotaxis protein
MSREPTRTLLRGGTVVPVDPAVGDFRGDVLIEGDVIADVGDLGEVPGAEVIDVRDHLVFPGFIDGHRHLYQTVLRGLGVEWSLVEYCIAMFGTVGAHLSAEDVYLGTLLGALDSIDAGVTGVYDLAHCQVTPEHTDRSLDALHESGLRTVFAYGGSSAQFVECLAPPFQSSTPVNDAEVRRLRNGPLSDDGALVTLGLFGRGPATVRSAARQVVRGWRPCSWAAAARRVQHPPCCVGSPLHAGVSLVMGARKAADMTVSLFILVQERIFADVLAIRLEREPDMEVVAALDTSALPSRIRVASRVDVALLDADLADNAAFRLGQELSQAPGAPSLVFLSHSNDPERIAGAVRVGAAGWVRKDESLDRLIYVIRGVARGETWLPPDQTGETL